MCLVCVFGVHDFNFDLFWTLDVFTYILHYYYSFIIYPTHQFIFLIIFHVIH